MPTKPFAKGNRLNPGGEWADKPFREALRRALKRTDPKSKAIQLDRLAVALIASGCEGNVAALKEIADRIDGKVAQPQEVTGADGGPIESTLKISFVGAP